MLLRSMASNWRVLTQKADACFRNKVAAASRPKSDGTGALANSQKPTSVMMYLRTSRLLRHTCSNPDRSAIKL